MTTVCICSYFGDTRTSTVSIPVRYKYGIGKAYCNMGLTKYVQIQVAAALSTVISPTLKYRNPLQVLIPYKYSRDTTYSYMSKPYCTSTGSRTRTGILIYSVQTISICLN